MMQSAMLKDQVKTAQLVAYEKNFLSTRKYSMLHKKAVHVLVNEKGRF